MFILPKTDFEEYVVIDRELFGGRQKVYKFPNGYGASVINHEFSYGLEVAVVEFIEDEFAEEEIFTLVFDTPVTDDVIGYCTEEQVNEILQEVYKL